MLRSLVLTAALAALSIGFAVAPAAAHKQKPAVREIVLLRGIVQPAGTCTPNFELRILDRTVHLCDAAVRRVAVATADIADQPTPASFDLQGDRSLVAPLLGAAAGERVSVLGEWRPGRKDVFAIEIDVCPCADREPKRP